MSAKSKTNFLSVKLYVQKEYGTEKIIPYLVPYRSVPENTVRNSVPYFFPKFSRTVPYSIPC